MREKLMKADKARRDFIGKCEVISVIQQIKTVNYKIYCLNDVTEISGEWLCDHVWLKVSERQLRGYVIEEGKMVRFEGQISPYTKESGEFDYGFTDVKIMSVYDQEN